ncbi:LytR/AlgR family response regulator transcription factor [Flavobacterium geliluteum]|uniref:Response regulator transcription factor n=1 Tax=Flavobacterium geliluteum TaxID=2816120 RepID=A0A940X5X0_9FLAO|nr:LytTR family DNA-binding domain-containing protein [Flavobacterium geliluteum]MBP4138393.1 response regulator transcription factor [Flavobacterium geliluteum]
MNCIVVDDEPLAREVIKDLITTQPKLKFIQEFNSASKAEIYLKSNTVDLIFLDIEMPGLNGLKFAESVPVNTFIIFTTAYRNYAVESYSLDAVDYLLKPIFPDRFAKAVGKAISLHKLLLKEDSDLPDKTKNFLFVKADRKYYKILFEKILFIQGLKDYSLIYSGTEKIMTLLNLKTLHKQLPLDKFIRVSKSYIVNETAIDAFDNNTIYIKDHQIPIGKVYQDDFYKQYIDKEI